MMEINIDLGKDFHFLPFGRFRADGKYSAEAFLNDNLYPALEKSELVTVDLSNAFGLGSSFLDGVFGVLAATKKWDLITFQKHIKIVSNVVPMLETEIFEYVKEAYDKTSSS